MAERKQFTALNSFNTHNAALEVTRIGDGSYWAEITNPTEVCTTKKYRMMAWNLTTVDWEFWIANGSPNSNNPSGDPITDIMIIDSWE